MLFGSKAYSNLGLRLGFFDLDALLLWGVKDFDNYSLNGITVTSDQMKQQILTRVVEPGAATSDPLTALATFMTNTAKGCGISVQLVPIP